MFEAHEMYVNGAIAREAAARLLAYYPDDTADELRSKINLYAQIVLKAVQEIVALAPDPGAVVAEAKEAVDEICG